MSGQELRNEIIRENLPKLIASLTGFGQDEENFNRCEQFAWSTIRNHRNLSVNSHAIKREIEGMQEKFIVGNYPVYADHLARLCDELTTHPICLDHYEVDVAWSILELLFSLSYNPVGALRKNKHKISLDVEPVEENNEEKELQYWSNVLKEDFIPLDELHLSDESDLSDWSDCSDTETNSKILQNDSKLSTHIASDEQSNSKWIIKSPEKELHFTKFLSEKSQEWLMTNVQNSWWLNNSSHCQIDSTQDEANFARIWNQYLRDSTINLIKIPDISTEHEYALLREIIWMFHSSGSCKFFEIKQDEIYVRRNVTIPSLSVRGLKSFLEDAIIPYIRMYIGLNKFINSIYIQDVKIPPKTYECYAASLKEIINPFNLKLLEMEDRFKTQNPLEINTLIQFQAEMREEFLFLQQLHELHTFVVLDFHSYPAHILSAHLLAGLFYSYQTASSITTSNLAITLFLSSVKIFCKITDTWWSEGRLDDWQNEFLIDKMNNEMENICIRPYSKDKEKSFFVPANISNIITDNKFLNLLMSHSLEAGYTLNLLYQINKIGDMRNACNFQGHLYQTFLDDIMLSISKYHKEADQCLAINEPETKKDNSPGGLKQFISDCVTTSDEFLLMSFICNMELAENIVSDKKSVGTTAEWTSQAIYDKLNKISKIVLPLEEIIIESISKILKSRISFANNFVIQMYRKEFGILKHLQNIRKVLLLESSDLMHYFYVKLFIQIESGKQWANPFLLTVQLDDIMCSKFPHISSLFRVEINSSFRCQTSKVMEVVDELTIAYNISKELSYIITEDSLQEYNKVFRFLLKVKWGLWTVENLQFPRSHKRRPPYAEYRMMDMIMRRLEQMRFWMMYALQCIHFHLMTQVLQSMGKQLDEKIANSTNLSEMKSVHKSFISTVCAHCFITDNSKDVKFGVEQLLNLAYVLRLEWNGCVKSIESNGMFSSDESIEEAPNNYMALSTIESIELTYIRCHQYLAKTLNNEVYVKQNTFLAGLSAAFNTSIPY